MAGLHPSETWWALPEPMLFGRLEITAAGLTRVEAIRRASLQEPLAGRGKSTFALLIDQFRSPIILLLMASALLIFGLGWYDARMAGERFVPTDAPDGLIILFILLASGLLGFWQERSAADAVARLLGLIRTTSTVLRDGERAEVPLADVVCGDVILLSAGDVIPADCRLLTAEDLLLNEASLTGESFPAEKTVGEVQPETPLARRANVVYLGTHVVSGYGTAVVAATGADTEFGRISGRLEHRAPETGFERGVRQFGQLLIRIVIAITVVVFGVKVGFQDKPLMDSLLVGLALAVGMTPQLLPAVTSVVLAAGAKAMSKRQVIVKQLLAIENLGSMTVLCADKTGTLTDGTIRVHETLDPGGNRSEEVLRLAAINATLQAGFVNPVDRALNDASQTLAIDMPRKLDEVPYDFIRKRLSVLVDTADGPLMITKGAFVPVLACCTSVLLPGETKTLAEVETAVMACFRSFSDAGYRVLGVASRQLGRRSIARADEENMVFRGFLVFADPPKVDARTTIGELRDLGVALKVITGDNHAVAASICQQVGIEGVRIVRGADLHSMDEAQLFETVNAADIFAEVEPNQKEQIVLALKRSGQTVGFLGDGINDASALHAADVGVSVADAVDVAREAAQVVLLKQDLAVLVEGVREGRRTFANTRKYVFFAIAANFGYMFSLAVAGLVLPFEPLLAAQILLVNLLADFPAMALATDRVDPEQIQRPRRWDTRFILRFMMSFGLASSCFDFLMFGAMYVFFAGLASGGDSDAFARLFQTGWFIQSTLTGLVIMAVIRTRRSLWRSEPGRLFRTAVLMIAALTLVLPYSQFGPLMGFVQPPAELLGMVLVITLLYAAGMETVKRFFYGHLAGDR